MIIWLELRHFKAYKNKNFIPIWFEHNFVSYTWENGVWKSSILEGLNTFLNNKDWLLTKLQKSSEAYIAPIFLIPKNKVSRLIKEFEIISNFFWDLDKKEKNNDFFELRANLIENDINVKNEKYLIFLWENFDRDLYYPFWEKGKKDFDKYLIDNWIDSFSEKKFLKEIKDLYSYVYIPVEIDMESFTKIETIEMQKIFDKELKDEIKTLLDWVNLDRTWWINEKLKDFILEIEDILDHKYNYETWMQRYNTVTKTDLTEKILEVYFQKRILTKKENDWIKKKISELSAWEKRQALINLVYAFLKRKDERDKIVIIAIDEPENSLHTTICYEQFEKLKAISINSQVLITTHWYWFLPIIDKWIVHFLKINNGGIYFFHKVDLYLYPYQTKNLPKDLSLKSTNDLVQSIYYSLKAPIPYNWIICEWPSDQIYLKTFLNDVIISKNIKIISVWWIELVKKFYRYLELPISENIDNELKWKVFCLTDTDNNLRKLDINQSLGLKDSLIIKRLATWSEHSTKLVKFEVEVDQNSHWIEQSLNPIIFKKTLESLGIDEKYLIDDGAIQNLSWNTTKENLRNFDIEWYFSSEKIKNDFANKYIETLNKENNSLEFIPIWINEIKTFFNT